MATSSSFFLLVHVILLSGSSSLKPSRMPCFFSPLDRPPPKIAKSELVAHLIQASQCERVVGSPPTLTHRHPQLVQPWFVSSLVCIASMVEPRDS